MGYPVDMIRNRLSRGSTAPEVTGCLPAAGALFVLSLLTLGFSSCGLIPLAGRPSDVADEFYEIQEQASEAPEDSLFTDEGVADSARTLLERRNEMYGECLSYRRVGSNRMISLEGGGREETITYIFDVECRNGRTRETLIIRRSRIFDPYRIVSYEIEEVPRIQTPAPVGTSST